MLEPLIVVEARAITRLGRYQKIWMAGWCAATLALVSTGVLATKLYEAHRNAENLEVLIAKVQVVQDEQRAINDTYIQAWKNQQETTDLVVTWGQYIKDRDTIVRSNRQSSAVVARRVQ